jgi:Rrf2 family transcriptional regulator, iron-sulfur cluster assembly transcription factor
MLPRRFVMAIAAVVDVALHARAEPVAARALAARHGLSPRHLEPVLQDLVRHGILKGVRGPHGGYQLARERRRISAGDIVRAVETEEPGGSPSRSGLVGSVVEPAVEDAVAALMRVLDALTVSDLCQRAEEARVSDALPAGGEFHI